MTSNINILLTLTIIYLSAGAGSKNANLYFWETAFFYIWRSFSKTKTGTWKKLSIPSYICCALKNDTRTEWGTVSKLVDFVARMFTKSWRRWRWRHHCMHLGRRKWLFIAFLYGKILSCICLCRDMFNPGPKCLCPETCRDMSHICRRISHMSENMIKTNILSWRHVATCLKTCTSH